MLRAVVGEGLTLALMGVMLGIAGGLGAMRVVAQYIYGVRATDPLTFTVVSGVLLIGRGRGQLRARAACRRRGSAHRAAH